MGDSVLKKKYHKWFNDKGAQYQLPMSLQEEQEDRLSDSRYINATKDLRVHANSRREEYPRVYQELKKYNYWRNLYGCKKMACAICVVLIAREVFSIKGIQLKELLLNSGNKYNVLLGLIAWMIIYCMFVNQKVVERSAFDYAVTLIETICGTDGLNIH